jgi:CRP/FNR family transcriptional regulator, cyclic AMP receptor protein
MAKSLPSGIDIFSELPDDLFEPLLRRARRVRVKANHMLFLAGDSGDGCYRIDEGLLKVTVVSASGTERILAILGAGAMVGELSIIDGGLRSNSVGAVRDSVLSFISRADFHRVAERNPDIYRHVATLLAGRLRDVNQVVAASSFLSLKGRVARALLSLAEAFGQDVGSERILIRQRVSQSDLAAMAGIARENVSRILNNWKRLAVVSQLAGYYCLEKRAELMREAEL